MTRHVHDTQHEIKNAFLSHFSLYKTFFPPRLWLIPHTHSARQPNEP